MRHTPGPWIVERDIPALPLLVAAPDGGCVAIIKGAAEQEENARLIAAAPDMLAALKEIARVWYHHHSATLAKPAILKAEGAYAPPEGYRLVYSGGHHDVYCSGERHIWTRGGGTTQCYPAVFGREARCDCPSWKDSAPKEEAK